MKEALSLDPRRTAFLAIDLQEEHRRDPRYLVEDFTAVLAHVRALQRAARQAGVPVIHAQYVVDTREGAPHPFHPMMPDGRSAFSALGDTATAICPEVAPLAGEPVITKNDASVFSVSETARQLAERNVAWLMVAGVWSEACISASVNDAVARGFRVVLVKDACASATRAMHQAAILNLANRLYGGAVVDTRTACRLLAGETVEAWQVQGSVPLKYTFDDAERLYGSL
ncbi:isochorismatase family protein [Ancylobacter moscoviensis]